jgi:hypothetical protein
MFRKVNGDRKTTGKNDILPHYTNLETNMSPCWALYKPIKENYFKLKAMSANVPP